MGIFPPTVIVVHPKERRSKCSVEPLRGRPDFLFCRYGARAYPDLEGYVQLGLGGPLLGPEDRASGLLVLDGTWRLVSRMQTDFAHVPVRSLPPWKTAYPRTSKLHEDPGAGLATIEAIFAAYVILGRSTSGLLDEYLWAEEFRRQNQIASD